MRYEPGNTGYSIILFAGSKPILNKIAKEAKLWPVIEYI